VDTRSPPRKPSMQSILSRFNDSCPEITYFSSLACRIVFPVRCLVSARREVFPSPATDIVVRDPEQNGWSIERSCAPIVGVRNCWSHRRRARKCSGLPS